MPQSEMPQLKAAMFPLCNNG
ncbi:hypothetical protein BCEP4_40004 [Burkholderia cepacia]|nr:hypothetical protein BCEP4_40004 [Burkholderia cepacia]